MFPILSDSEERSHSGISGSMITSILPEHYVGCHALLQLLSLVIHLITLVTKTFLWTASLTNMSYEITFLGNYTRLANQPLYRYNEWVLIMIIWVWFCCFGMSMDPSGFEPEAPALQGRCSTGLSYRPTFNNKVIIKKMSRREVLKKKKRRWSHRRFPYGDLVTT